MKIISDNKKATAIIEFYVNLAIADGGTFHEDLEVHFGTTAKIGMMSLAGVNPEDLALLIPTSLYLDPFGAEWQESEWSKLHSLAGYNFSGNDWFERTFETFIVPIADMVNHEDGCQGRIDMYGKGVALYGSTVNYGGVQSFGHPSA